MKLEIKKIIGATSIILGVSILAGITTICLIPNSNTIINQNQSNLKTVTTNNKLVPGFSYGDLTNGGINKENNTAIHAPTKQNIYGKTYNYIYGFSSIQKPKPDVIRIIKANTNSAIMDLSEETLKDIIIAKGETAYNNIKSVELESMILNSDFLISGQSNPILYIDTTVTRNDNSLKTLIVRIDINKLELNDDSQYSIFLDSVDCVSLTEISPNISISYSAAEILLLTPNTVNITENFIPGANQTKIINLDYGVLIGSAEMISATGRAQWLTKPPISTIQQISSINVVGGNKLQLTTSSSSSSSNDLYALFSQMNPLYEPNQNPTLSKIDVGKLGLNTNKITKMWQENINGSSYLFGTQKGTSTTANSEVGSFLKGKFVNNSFQPNKNKWFGNGYEVYAVHSIFNNIYVSDSSKRIILYDKNFKFKSVLYTSVDNVITSFSSSNGVLKGWKNNGDVDLFNSSQYLFTNTQPAKADHKIVESLASIKFKNNLSDELKTRDITSFNNTMTSSALKILFSEPNNEAPPFGLAPDLKFSVSQQTSGGKNLIEIKVEQAIRLLTIDSQLNITAQTPLSTVLLGTKEYEIFNKEAHVTNLIPDSNIEGSSLPLIVRSQLPSEFLTNNKNLIQQYLYKIQNVINPKIKITPDDTLGILKVKIVANYCWLNGERHLKPTIWEFNYRGFRRNIFSNFNKKLTLIDDAYLVENPEVKINLVVKFSKVLPTILTPKIVLSDFVVIPSEISELDIKPTITIYPNSLDGNAVVSLVYDDNVSIPVKKYIWTLPKVFKADISMSKEIEVAFLDADVVAKRSFPSQVANSLANPILTSTVVKKYLEISDYLISLNPILIVIDPNDYNGTFILQLSFDLDVEAKRGYFPGHTKASSFSKLFTGFKTNEVLVPKASSFSFITLDDLKIINPAGYEKIIYKTLDLLTPQEVADNLIVKVEGVKLDQDYSIELNFNNNLGELDVIVTYFYFYEKQSITGKDEIKTIHNKIFTQHYTGFSKVTNPVKSLSWKSNSEITDQTIFKNTPSDFANAFNKIEGPMINKLLPYVNLSEWANQLFIDSSTLEVNLIPNNQLGTISFQISITDWNPLEEESFFTNELTGFTRNAITSGADILTLDENSPILIGYKQTSLPGNLVLSDWYKFFTIPSYMNNWNKSISVESDNYTGTLKLTLEITPLNLASTSDNVIGQSIFVTKFYTGFKKIPIPPASLTNIGIVAGVSSSITVIMLVCALVIVVIARKMNNKATIATTKIIEAALDNEKETEEN